MAKPTKQALQNAWHTCSYMFGTSGYGVRLEEKKKGQSMMDFRDVAEVEDGEEHLLEIVTDSDHAGNKNDRKSTTSMQLYLDGNLIDSKVRSQKAIALSSGESEFMALVSGCSEGMLLRRLWNQITGGSCRTKARSDSSAARGMTQRQGIGRVRHMDAAMLWIQQKERDKIIQVGPIPTDLNSADIRAKNLPKKRLRGLLYMMGVIDAVGDRVGEEQFQEIEKEYQMKMSLKKFNKSKDLRIGLLMLMANLGKASGEPAEEGQPGDQRIDLSWWAFCLCALLGALSLCAWMRDYVNALMKGIGIFLQNIKKTTIQMKNTYKSVRAEMKDSGIQAPQWLDAQHCAKCTDRIKALEFECFSKGTYIEELEAQMERMKESLGDFLKEREIAEKYSSRLEERLHQLRMTPAGRALHFSRACPHFAGQLKSGCVNCP